MQSQAELGRLVGSARRAVRSDETVEGLRPLSGGLSHDVFEADTTQGPVIVKVFRSVARDEHDREREGLAGLKGTGIAPKALHFDADEGLPVVVMSRVDGQAADVASLTSDHMQRIADAHRLMWSVRPRSDRLSLGHPSVTLHRTRALLDEWDGSVQHVVDGPGVRLAGESSKAWLASSNATALVDRADSAFGRGDPNISNYLWTEDSLQLIDFEDSGVNDPVFELGDMAEHLSMRPVEETLWTVLADASQLNSGELSRFADSRRLLACFWLGVLERRTRRGDPPVQVDLSQQAERVLSLLG
jgi:aminoglycoside phosphotransferase (APT) family kinase protein